MRRTAVWDTIQFAANGMIFELLGEQLPEILSGTVQTVALTGHLSPRWLALAEPAALVRKLAQTRPQVASAGLPPTCVRGRPAGGFSP